MPAGAETPHLLVVDDDERLRALLQRYLSTNGFRVSAAANAAEARALMKSIAFDLLIVDVMMPGETGLELTKSVRAQSQVPILMLTARGEAEDRIAGPRTRRRRLSAQAVRAARAGPALQRAVAPRGAASRPRPIREVADGRRGVRSRAAANCGARASRCG